MLGILAGMDQKDSHVVSLQHSCRGAKAFPMVQTVLRTMETPQLLVAMLFVDCGSGMCKAGIARFTRLAMCSLSLFAGPDARHHGRYGQEGLLRRDAVIDTPVVCNDRCRGVTYSAETADFPKLQHFFWSSKFLPGRRGRFSWSTLFSRPRDFPIALEKGGRCPWYAGRGGCRGAEASSLQSSLFSRPWRFRSCCSCRVVNVPVQILWFIHALLRAGQSRRLKSSGSGIFWEIPLRKFSRIQRYLVRQWIHVRVSSRGCGRLCLATETGANCAVLCLDKGVLMPVVMHDRRSVQTVQKPVEAPQVQFPGKVVVDMSLCHDRAWSSCRRRQLEVPQIRSSPRCSRSEEGIFAAPGV